MEVDQILVPVERVELKPKRLLRSAVLSSWTPYWLYLLLAIVCWRAYAYRLGPDIISYLSIAQNYFTGQWGNAVNVFWSPLFSWLVAAGLVTHIAVYPLARAIVLLCGFVGLAGIRRLTLQCGLPRDLSVGVTLIAAPMLASFAILLPGPDFVALSLLILYLGAMCAAGPDTPRSWLFAGVIGAFLYLAKAYMFGFIVAHLTVTAILRAWSVATSSNRRKIVVNYAAAIACFFVLCSPWLIVISLKAGYPVLSAAGTWNQSKVPMDLKWFPQSTEGLFPPSNPAAVSVWEDPSRMPIPAWNPLSSAQSVRRQIYVAGRNVLYLIYFTIRASPFSVIILPFFVWMVLRQSPKDHLFNSWACLLSAYVIYPLGYILIALGEQRYVWIENVLLLIMFGCVANFIWTHRSRSRLVAIAVISAGLSFWCDPLATLVYHWGNRNDLHSLAESLRNLRLSGNVASNGQWEQSLYLCYELGLRYYGIPRNERSDEIQQELRKYHIRYVFLWNSPGVRVPVDSGREVRITKDLRIYLLHASEL